MQSILWLYPDGNLLAKISAIVGHQQAAKRRTARYNGSLRIVVVAVVVSAEEEKLHASRELAIANIKGETTNKFGFIIKHNYGSSLSLKLCAIAVK